MHINERDALNFIKATEKICHELKKQLASENDFSKYKEKIYEFIPDTEEEALLEKMTKVEQIKTFKVLLKVGYNKAHDIMKWFIAKGFIREVREGKCVYIYKGELLEKAQPKEDWFDD